MLIYIIIIVAGIILDQLSKVWAGSYLSGMTTYPIIPNVFHFTYVENTGAAFNIFTDMRLFLIIITMLFIGLLGYLFYILPKTKLFSLANLGLSLMLSGAIGNLIDRIRLSYVIDFIDFRIINFAVFNVADSLVVIGAFLLLFAYLKNQYIFTGGQEKETKKAEPAEKPLEPIYKDVLKDLKVKRSTTTDISPVVKTECIRLKSTPTPSYYPPPVENDTSRIYTSDDLYPPRKSEEIIINKENRYSQLSDQYLESVQKQRERDNSKKPSKNRYSLSIERYEKQAEKLLNTDREESNRSRYDSVWEPELNTQPKKAKTYDDWNPRKSEGTTLIEEESLKDFDTGWNPEVSHRKRETKTYEFNWNPDEVDVTIKDEEAEEPKKEENSIWNSPVKSRKRKAKTYEFNWNPQEDEPKEDQPDLNEDVKDFDTGWNPEISGNRKKAKSYDFNWNPEESSEDKKVISEEDFHEFESVWNPGNSEKNKKSGTYDFNWHPEQTEEPSVEDKLSRYNSQIESYQNSVNNQKTKEEFTGFDWGEVDTEENIRKEKPKNRYYEKMDHYIESIKEAKNKSYVDDTSEEE